MTERTDTRDDAVLYIDRLYDDRYPELVRHIATELFVTLMESPQVSQLGEAWVATLVYQVGEHVRETFGGIGVYIPKGSSYGCAMRDREIYARFRGDNYDELARETGLTVRRVQQIVSRCRAEDRRLRQRSLFEDFPPT